MSRQCTLSGYGRVIFATILCLSVFSPAYVHAQMGMAVSAEAAPFPEGKPKKKLKCEPVQFASKDSFDFGKVFLDENASVSEALTNPVTNPTVQIVFQVAEPNPPFPIERTDCNSLNPGAQCHIVVDFKPPKVGKYHGKLEVTYAGCPDAEHGKSSKLKLSGIGVAAQRTPTPTPTPCTSCSTATPTPTATQTATPTSTATPINRTATGLQIGASSFGNGDSYPLFGPCVADGGCTGMPPQDAPSAVANAVTPFSTCGTPVSIALGGGPPTVGVSGNVVVTCARTTPESSEIQCVASSDGGKTFGGIISPVESSGFSSAVVGAMDAHGAFHVLYQHTDNNFANLHNHSAILPPGTNFSPVLDLGANFDSSPDAIAVDLVTGSIYVTTSALDTNIQGNKLIEVRKSTDGGASFGSPVTVASVSSSMGGGFRAMTAKNDSVFIVYGTFDGSNNSTEVGYLSTDGGATFQSVGNLLTANGATVTQQTVQFLNGTEPPPSTTLSGFASGSSNQNAFYLRGDDSIVIGVQDGSGAMHLKQNTSANPSSFSDIVISNDSNISGSACAGNDTYAVCTWPTSTGAPANQLINFAARCSP